MVNSITTDPWARDNSAAGYSGLTSLIFFGGFMPMPTRTTAGPGGPGADAVRPVPPTTPPSMPPVTAPPTTPATRPSLPVSGITDAGASTGAAAAAGSPAAGGGGTGDGAPTAFVSRVGSRFNDGIVCGTGGGGSTMAKSITIAEVAGTFSVSTTGRLITNATNAATRPTWTTTDVAKLLRGCPSCGSTKS